MVANVESITLSLQEEPGSTSFVMDMPATKPDGDLYIAWVVKDDEDALTAVPGNWIEIDVGVTSLWLLCGLWYWIGDSEPETYTIEADNEEWSGAIIRISGQHADTPINKIGVATTGYGVPAAIPMVTPDCDNPLLLAFAGRNEFPWDESGQYPVGWDGLFTQSSSSSNQSASAIGASKEGENGVSSGAGTFNAVVEDRWRAMTIAIAPITSEERKTALMGIRLMELKCI